MKKSLLIIVLCATVPALAIAKKPKKVVEETSQQTVVTEPAEDEIPVITEECTINTSLFNESVKNKQFADAYEPWLSVFNECPNYSRVIYTQGSKILDWKYTQATTDEEKHQIRDMLMKLYDKRIKWFGDDAKYPTPYVLGLKGLDYIQYFPEDELKLTAYNWLRQSIDGMGNKSQVMVLVKYFELSMNMYKADANKYADQFVSDYTLVSGILTASTDASDAQWKDYVDNSFAVSGAADCTKMDELYATFVKENTTNLDEMLKLMKLYRRVNCTESEVYFAAAEAAHKLKPTEESAAGCAKMCLKKNDPQGAIAYFKQAIEMIDITDPEANKNRADYYYNIAMTQYKDLGNYYEARNSARLSLESDPDAGRSYILIGLCYAAAKPYSNGDVPAAKAAILNKTVFWAAVDQFNKAKRADSSIVDLANKYIADFSKYFPTREDIFDLPELVEGETFIVGGWVGERTTCRAAK
ncbi:MAG: hypothetical protein MJZ88_03400 [Paludibacteraceae bacterium]|nr:hypothetical protein [Paludibacteraceae bacterium]